MKILNLKERKTTLKALKQLKKYTKIIIKLTDKGSITVIPDKSISPKEFDNCKSETIIVNLNREYKKTNKKIDIIWLVSISEGS